MSHYVYTLYSTSFTHRERETLSDVSKPITGLTIERIVLPRTRSSPSKIYLDNLREGQKKN